MPSALNRGLVCVWKSLLIRFLYLSSGVFLKVEVSIHVHFPRLQYNALNRDKWATNRDSSVCDEESNVLFCTSCRLSSEIFELMGLMCSLKFSSVSIVTPKNCPFTFFSTTWEPILFCMCSGIGFNEDIMKYVFLRFNVTLFADDQSFTLTHRLF